MIGNVPMDTSLKESVITELLKSNVLNADNLRNASGWLLEVLIDSYKRLSSCGNTPMDRLEWQEEQIRVLRQGLNEWKFEPWESIADRSNLLILNIEVRNPNAKRLS
jgi:hypothetical protein